MFETLSIVQKECFKKISGHEFKGELSGFFQTKKPYDNDEYKGSPWTFRYKFIKETGYLICELAHRLTNNRIYGWSQEGNELSKEITNKYFRSELDSLVKLKEENRNVIKFSKEGTISAKKVKESVYSRINFELPEQIWNEIDYAFGECWNNVIGITGEVNEGQIENYIFNHLKKQRIIFEFEKVEKIVKIIYDYITMTGGWLDD
jgi:hypothetical protein